MELIKTDIKDLFIIEPKIFYDDRGYFYESYNEKAFLELGLNYKFVQDNESKSTKGVLRGLHFQKTYQQAKCVRVIKGEVFDVAVDLRKYSITYGKYFGVILNEVNHRMFMIPRGFAHGFLVLSDEAIFSYKCDDFYHPNDEGGIIYNDPTINVKRPKIDSDIILSVKDKNHPTLHETGIKL
ncbi:MAG: dTDP-4-dehydrorhamnose 3,5-epimerase [Firmicutes bacterium]|uniref:dTDP-4-dehydrorhamnose 3,5-epimerase n=1 Tax=Candidatus Onthovivens merdipullorum TaxID=2840889 RepID=A0A9D9GXJ9_9BACL|nr:dTDP-4-dehydrorhamnose 3,5-epimerase [Candidatus Onthovivens merdipullorum]